jgi:solute carrier family 25 phosphate transporter 3
MLTRVNASADKNTTVTNAIVKTVKELGFSGLTRGLIPRMGMVGIMAACQLLVYDGAKLMLGLPTSTGVKANHHKQQ